MKTKKVLGAAAVLLVLGMGSAQAQVGMPTNNPQKNAQLDLNAANNANTKGLLLPRVALVATDNVAPLIGTVLSGMKVYNTATAGAGQTAVSPGEYYYDGAKWVRVGVDAPEPWYNAATKTAATSNTQNVYQMGNVGIGTNDPQAKLDVAKDALIYNLTVGRGGGEVTTNTVVGNKALAANTTGSTNTAIGVETLGANTTGFANTAIGTRALKTNVTGYWNTAVGQDALRNNQLGKQNVSVGVNSLTNNIDGYENSAFGFNALQINTSGSFNTAFGAEAFPNVTSGNYNVGIGYQAGGSIKQGTNNICIGFGANIADGSNQIRMGNTAISYAGIQVAWTVTSDARLKTNVENNPLGLDFVKQLRPVVYNRYANEGNGVNSKNEYGFIAQEVKGALEKNNVSLDKTGLVSYDESSDRYSVRYNDLISILTKAIQEQQTQIDELKKEVKTLKSK